mmetsp:Transcript_1981/g.2473  ORF Transcript_1981/g.2473 Transcript_1981/m.2473 type:complete len:128 (+) Transcript_1981:265-648(+)|eukprot:CAMPEP_0172507648 /NCGR_PEP_ID=MMETSP1066-20121228/205336_1 /TAXON_ID=671091 /ORGANISM="Coscinodiscus wailesii, Strain CCMP2513" /LENGTH=127 /DNA_ID=CAMNT_0013285265 /DNA_START=248 /DNA_END=631 /DNA_ORIENTATION=+
MIDPMANLDGGGGGPIPGGDATGGEGRDIFNLPAAQLNKKKMDTVRSFMGIVSGCVAGVCGLTGLEGLVCFFVLHLAVSLSLLMKMKFDLKSYSRESMISFMMADLQKNGLSFMLFWTLFYGLVYLF